MHQNIIIKSDYKFPSILFNTFHTCMSKVTQFNTSSSEKRSTICKHKWNM